MLVKNVRKILTLVAIISIVAIAGICISALFGADVFNGTTLKVLLTCALFAGVSAFSISALSYYEKKRVLSIVNLSMLATLGVMVFIIIWTGKFGIFAKITVTLAIATGLVGLMNGNIIQLGKKYRAFQIFSILMVASADVMLTLVVWEKYPFNDISTKLFVIAMIVAFVDVSTLSILARKVKGEIYNDAINQKTKIGDDEIVIKKSEYETMQQKIRELENEVNALKIKNLEKQVEILKTDKDE